MLAVRSWLPVKGNVNPAYTVLEDVMFTLVALHQLLMCLAVLHPMEDPDAARTLQAALARSQALVSGEIKYSARWKIGDVLSAEYHVIFQGDDYIYKSTSTGGIILNYQGKFIVYVPNVQPDGRSFPQARIEPAIAMDDDNANYPPPPVRAGSFGYMVTAHYLVAHAERVRQVGIEEVAGLRCVKLELKLAGEETGKALRLLFHDFIKEGGVVTVWIATEHGYVIPKMEVSTSSGILCLGSYGEEFSERAEGVWIPRQWRLVKQGRGREDQQLGRNYLEYTIESFTRINEPIPVELFQIDMPVGTGVVDERPNAEGKRAALFGIGVPSSPGERIAHDLAPVVPNLYPRAAPEDSSSSLWSVGIGVGAVVLVLLLGLAGAAYFYFRRRVPAAPAG